MRRWTGLLLALLALLAVPAGAHAADAIVTRTDDPSPDGCDVDGCSLREAVSVAVTGGGHTVTLPANATAYQVTLSDIAVSGEALIQGGGAATTTITGDSDNGILRTNSAASKLTLQGVTLTGGHNTTGTGGAINAAFGTLTVRDSVIAGNDTIVSGNNAQGGGIFVGASAISATIERSAISNNLAKSTTNAALGGGIQAQVPLTLTDSTVNDNRAEATANAVSAVAQGAGIFGSNDITVTDSTITGNVGSANATSAATSGGGVVISGSGSLLSLTGATVSANQSQGNSSSRGGNLLVTNSASVQPGRSIIAGGVAPSAGTENCVASSGGTFVTQGFNLEDRNQCGLAGGELHDTNPLLGTLGSFGGGTPTQPIAALSPARDAGGSCGDGADQRGLPRVGPCEIGAYERQAPVVTAGADRATATVGQAVGFTATPADADPGDTVSVAWSFDDGATATGPTASHAFATAGRHTATATATDSNGYTGSASVTVEVNAPAVSDTTPPGLSGLAFAPAAFPAASSGASVKAAVVRRPRVTGAKVSYRLTEAATVTFTVERSSAGRRVRGRCVKPTRANRTAPRCTRFVAVRGSFTHSGKAGLNSFRFTGRVGGRKLAPGAYRLVASARDAAGNRAKIVRKAFVITR